MVAVRRIEFLRFGPYEQATLDLPERGVMLVTGPNGAGKTTFMQAVAHALWGKQIVGDPMWPPGEASKVGIGFNEDSFATRSCTKSGTKKLKLEAGEFPTTGKAQEQVESVIGPMHVWRWSSVFVSDAPDVFTRATDRERKRLLEEILDLDRFDTALKETRNRIAVETTKVGDHTRRIENLTYGIQSAQSALDAAEPPNPTDEELAAAEAAEAEGRRVAAHYNDTQSELTDCYIDAGFQPTEEDQEAERWRAALEKSPECPMCGAELDRSEAEAKREWVEKQEADRDRRRQACHEEQGRIQAMIDKVNEALTDAQAAWYKPNLRMQELQAQRAAHQRWTKSTEQQRLTIEENTAEVARLTESRTEHEANVELLRGAEQVFGLKGVRARMTGRALSAIEAAANERLAQLGGDGWAIRLRAYREQKSGKKEEKIGLEVRAPDRADRFGWRGYWSASTGQRRRFDLAVMLAVADVVRGLRGGVWSTLWFDEAIDALDEEGKRRAVSMLQELGKQTCVVVVSHDDAIVDRLKADRHVHVEDGEIC